jgi:tetratricopeptide (TPR) repeat protein
MIYVENELFLGRLEEQDRFREALREVLAGRLDEQASPYIILVYGEGGMGKSQLTRRLYDIVTSEPPFERDCAALRLDWEIARNQTPDLRLPREQIHPETVLDTLHRAALDRNWGRYFSAYQDKLNQRRQAEQEAAKALEREQEQGRYTAIRDLGAAGLAKLIRLAVPVMGQTGEEFSQALLSAGIQLGAEQAVLVRQQAEQFLQARLKPELYDLYRQPHEQLARSLAEGFRRVSREQPLVILLDTYEIVAAAADLWLRLVMTAAGPRIAWLLAGRDNLAASRPGQRYVGYSAEFSRRLLLWDLQELAIQDVTAYVAGRAPQRLVTPDEALALHRATLGVPLALKQAADLWAKGVPLEAIAEGIPDYTPREEIVRLMCERVLLHVEPGPAGELDRRDLYTLAMQPRPDPELQALILRPGEDDLLNLPVRLAELARRYSAVQVAGGGHLHAAMGEFIREYLLRTEAGRAAWLKTRAGRAAEILQRRRASLEQELFDLAERLDSDDWKQTSLDLLHWLFWQEEAAAWRELVPRLVEGLGYDLNFSRSLLAAAARFRPRLSQDGLKRLKRLQLDEANRETLLTELERLADRGHWLDQGDPAAQAERRAILWLWRGRWQTGEGRYAEALQSCLAAERGLPEGAAGLREQLSRALYEVSSRFLWPEGAASSVPSQPGLQAAQLAAELDPENGSAWYNVGVALSDLGSKEEAIAAYRQAIALDPKLAYPHNGLGNLYGTLGRSEEAIAAYRQAIALDPKYAAPHNGLGNVYDDLGQSEEATAAYHQAIALDPKYAAPHHGLGDVYHALGRSEEAIAAYRQTIALDPKFAYPHNGLGNVYGDLGQSEEAIAAYRQAIALDPKWAGPHTMLGALYELAGRLEEAAQMHRRAVELEPDDGTNLASLASALRKLGREAEAVEYLERARALMAQENDYNKACFEAIAGNVGAALDYLAAALKQAPGDRAWARQDPDLAALRGNPRFEALVGV